jgi:hypothetical protein
MLSCGTVRVGGSIKLLPNRNGPVAELGEADCVGIETEIRAVLAELNLIGGRPGFRSRRSRIVGS